MREEDKPPPQGPNAPPASDGPLGGIMHTLREGRHGLPYKTMRPKRRRKGYLNDGQWAPGYGPEVKRKE